MPSQSQTPPRGGFFTLGAWQRADDLVVKVYEVTDVKKGYFPRDPLYGLTQALQQAAVSVAAHIAEGELVAADSQRVHSFPLYCQRITQRGGIRHPFGEPFRLSPPCGASGGGALLGFIACKEKGAWEQGS
ncbi:four helix bundle protein [Candidatus Poribacteria bacterium]|nr:four helix bundle protein [Candidatus Poribacteria bacterium]